MFIIVTCYFGVSVKIIAICSGCVITGAKECGIFDRQKEELKYAKTADKHCAYPLFYRVESGYFFAGTSNLSPVSLTTAFFQFSV